MEQSGKFWFSTTELKGKSWFRINPVNFRTRTEHMDQLLAWLEQECGSVDSTIRAANGRRKQFPQLTLYADLEKNLH